MIKIIYKIHLELSLIVLDNADIINKDTGMAHETLQSLITKLTSFIPKFRVHRLLVHKFHDTGKDLEYILNQEGVLMAQLNEFIELCFIYFKLELLCGESPLNERFTDSTSAEYISTDESSEKMSSDCIDTVSGQKLPLWKIRLNLLQAAVVLWDAGNHNHVKFNYYLFSEITGSYCLSTGSYYDSLLTMKVLRKEKEAFVILTSFGIYFIPHKLAKHSSFENDDDLRKSELQLVCMNWYDFGLDKGWNWDGKRKELILDGVRMNLKDKRKVVERDIQLLEWILKKYLTQTQSDKVDFLYV